VPVEPLRTVEAPTADRQWVDWAVARLHADARRSADTHLLRLPVSTGSPVDIYVKDESTHPTGSLKHRLARSLFLYAICNGDIGRGSTVVEASSGSTAISEAYFARLVGLPFVAVVARSTSPGKIALIEREGGRCEFVGSAGEVYDAARRFADELGGHYLDQFTNAERATDWRGNNNIAESIFSQLALERHAVPDWVVVGAGTGGTSATIGRYLRYRRLPTRLAVVDPEGSSFFPGWRDRDPGAATGCSSRIEGIGRPRVEPSFIPTIVDRMICVPDAASLAAMRELERTTGRRAGGSTGTNLWGAFQLVAEMVAAGRRGSVVTLLCDGGERYAHTYYSDGWVADQGLDLTPHTDTLRRFAATGEWRDAG
jgi:cysteine synthase